MKALDDLRAEVFAFLELGGAPHEVAVAGYERVKAALDAARAAKPSHAEADALWKEIEQVVRERYSMKFLSPLYPWGVVAWVRGLPESIRYEELARHHVGPCNCAFVREHRFYERLQSEAFEQVGESNDFYDRYVEYRCPNCQSLWRRVDASTEQVSDWGWEPVSTDGTV